MNPEPITLLSIDGKRITSFTKIKLEQKTNDHHQFEIILDNDVIEVIGGHTIDTSKDWLGKSLIITFDKTEFLGYITAVNLENKDGHNGNLILNGYSPTILLEGGSSMYSWVNNTLEAIINQTLETLNIGTEINPVFKEVIEYQVQYNENNYQFLQRLAKQYNEWFYYNGTQILFGKPKRGEVVHIEYGREISEIRLEIKVNDHSQTRFSYNARMNSLVASTSKDQVEGLNELGSHAFHTSAEIYKPKKNSFTHIDTQMKSQIDDLVARKQATASAGLHVMKAKSNKQGLTVGTIIKVESAKVTSSETNGKSTFNIQNYGEYMITSITHEATERSEYFNTFEAIPSGIAVPEEPNIALPKAETQIATVISNEDPKGIGRVQVKFDWQINTLKTSWLRVMTPDAGSSKQHSKNRGHVFIPEIDDQVMVGFEYNDPNRPFVMGGMFHGDNGAGGSANNNIKSIITKSGHMIEFNDTPNSESITITDRNKNTIFLDTANKDIRISAPHKITLNATDIELNARNNLTFNASNNTEFNVSNNFVINAMTRFFVFTPYLKQTVSGFMHLFSGKTLINSLNSISIESKEVQTIGTEKVLIHSDEKTIINSKGIAEMHGTKKNSFTNKAITVQIVPPEEIALAVVEFRTEQGTYNGEFGFDWLRIDDNSLTTEKKYEDIIDGGYKDGVTDLSKADAFTNLQGEYDSIPIKPKTSPSTMMQIYYVPYLNLYSKGVSQTVKIDPIKPAYKAKLRVLVEIEEDIDKLEFDYDKKIFTIDKPILSDKTKTTGKVASADSTIEITCNKLITSEEKGEIKIYAYPKGSSSKTPAEQLLLRKLAGKIKVGRNDKGFRRKKQFVLVKIKTNTSNIIGNETTGTFISTEKNMLQKALYQSLVYAGLNNAPDLDLSKDTNFQVRTNASGVKTYGKFIFKNTTGKWNKTDGNIYEDHVDIFDYVQDLFLKQNPKYIGYYTMFCFDENTYDSYFNALNPVTGSRSSGAVPGQVQKVNTENVFLFNSINGTTRGNVTIAHEGLHGFGPHTHKNGTPIKESDREYTFDKYETDNFMAYTKQAGKTKRSLWKWQWDIIKDNI